jgi:Fic family protein
MNEVHEILLQGVRGANKRPGELRTSQVWIAPAGTPIEEAKFIPSPHNLLRDLLGEWEKFVNESGKLPLLVQCALMHYQIETIHPYLDGNGRIGRLLITLFLYEKELLGTPLLYLSAYFERDRQRYYDELYRVSDTGDYATWLLYFLKGVAEQAQDAVKRVRSVRGLQEEYRQILHDRRDSGNGLRLLDLIFAQLVVSVSGAAKFLDVTHAGARGVLDRLCDAGVIEHIPDTWPRLYVASDLIREINPPD